MNNDQLISVIFGTNGKAPYDATSCYELEGKNFILDIVGIGNCPLCIHPDSLDFCGRTSSYTCVKCEDNVYFLLFGDGDALLLDATSGAAIFAERCHALYKSAEVPTYVGELCGGWLDACFIPGCTVHIEFADGRVLFDDTEFRASYAKLADSIYTVSIGNTVIVIDTARFLLYAATETTGMFSGYARPV